jgi:WD40 repeat protein
VVIEQPRFRVALGGLNFNPFDKLAFSPDSQSIVMTSQQDGEIVMDAATGKHWSTYKPPDEILELASDALPPLKSRTFLGDAGSLTFTLDAKAVVVATAEHDIRRKVGRCDLVSGKFDWLFDCPRGKILAAQCRADGRWLVLHADGQHTLLTNLGTQKTVSRAKIALTPVDDSFTCAAISHDGSQAVVMTRTHLWLVSTTPWATAAALSEIQREDKLMDGFKAMACSPTAAIAVTYSETRKEKKGTIWDLSSGKAKEGKLDWCFNIMQLAFSPDGRWLAGATVDGSVILWEMAGGHRAALLKGLPSPEYPRALALSADRTMAALLTSRSELWVWELTPAKVDGH